MSIKASLMLAAAALMAGCAGQPALESYAIAGGTTAPAAVSALPAPAPGGASAYVLSEEEKGAGCKRLTGRMKIRILQIKDHVSRHHSTELARSLHTAQSQFGASGAGADTDAEYRRSLSMLEAYNGELQRRGCPTLDLAKELAPTR